MHVVRMRDMRIDMHVSLFCIKLVFSSYDMQRIPICVRVQDSMPSITYAYPILKDPIGDLLHQ